MAFWHLFQMGSVTGKRQNYFSHHKYSVFLSSILDHEMRSLPKTGINSINMKADWDELTGQLNAHKAVKSPHGKTNKIGIVMR